MLSYNALTYVSNKCHLFQCRSKKVRWYNPVQVRVFMYVCMYIPTLHIIDIILTFIIYPREILGKIT